MVKLVAHKDDNNTRVNLFDWNNRASPIRSDNRSGFLSKAGLHSFLGRFKTAEEAYENALLRCVMALRSIAY